MARKTSLKESTRRKGQLRVDQQAALRKIRRQKVIDPDSVVRIGEAIAVRKKKAKKKKRKRDPGSVQREGEVNTIGGVSKLLRRRRKQREAIFE